MARSMMSPYNGSPSSRSRSLAIRRRAADGLSRPWRTGLSAGMSRGRCGRLRRERLRFQRAWSRRCPARHRPPGPLKRPTSAASHAPTAVCRVRSRGHDAGSLSPGACPFRRGFPIARAPSAGRRPDSGANIPPGRGFLLRGYPKAHEVLTSGKGKQLCVGRSCPSPLGGLPPVGAGHPIRMVVTPRQRPEPETPVLSGPPVCRGAPPHDRGRRV